MACQAHTDASLYMLLCTPRWRPPGAMLTGGGRMLWNCLHRSWANAQSPPGVPLHAALPPVPKPRWVGGFQVVPRPQAHAMVAASTCVVCAWCGRWGMAGAVWHAGQCGTWAACLPSRVVGMLAGPRGIEAVTGDTIVPSFGRLPFSGEFVACRADG